jgi:hypothetical protein
MCFLCPKPSVKLNIPFGQCGHFDQVGLLKSCICSEKNFKKAKDIYYGMVLVISKELKYVLLKMCTLFHKYLWALKKSLEIWYA